MSSFVRFNKFGTEYLDVTLNDKKSRAKGTKERFESYIEIKRGGLYKISTSGTTVRSSKGDYDVMKLDITPCEKRPAVSSGAFGTRSNNRGRY